MGRCRCHSGKTEKRCCGPWLSGRPAPTPLALMRSRYAAYARGDVDYVIRTTDPEGPMWQEDRAAWAEEIRQFSRAVGFAGLEIVEAPEPAGDEGQVVFRAVLRDGQGRDVGFTERSRFRRRGGVWRYWGKG